MPRAFLHEDQIGSPLSEAASEVARSCEPPIMSQNDHREVLSGNEAQIWAEIRCMKVHLMIDIDTTASLCFVPRGKFEMQNGIWHLNSSCWTTTTTNIARRYADAKPSCQQSSQLDDSAEHKRRQFAADELREDIHSHQDIYCVLPLPAIRWMCYINAVSVAAAAQQP